MNLDFDEKDKVFKKDVKIFIEKMARKIIF